MERQYTTRYEHCQAQRKLFGGEWQFIKTCTDRFTGRHELQLQRKIIFEFCQRLDKLCILDFNTFGTLIVLDFVILSIAVSR